jgi:hypothetical protein
MADIGSPATPIANIYSNGTLTLGTVLGTLYGGSGLAHPVVTCVPYTGTGVDNRTVAHTLGATPDVVICIGTSSGAPWTARGSNFSAGASKSSTGTGESAGIKSFDGTNITLGTASTCNANGDTYVAICIKST